MTLLAEIQAKCSPELLATRDCAAITAKVNEGRKRIQQPTLIGDGDVTQAIGRPAGPMLADWLEQAASERVQAKVQAALGRAGEG